jgi:hypothetical protein
MGVCTTKESIEIVPVNNKINDSNINNDDLNNIKNNENELSIENNNDNLDNNEVITDNESGPILKLLKQNVKQKNI